MPPVILWALGAVGVIAVVKWVVKEAGRINAELEAQRAAADALNRKSAQTLKRDPKSGVYRPQ
jgi:hypothetical protein